MTSSRGLVAVAALFLMVPGFNAGAGATADGTGVEPVPSTPQVTTLPAGGEWVAYEPEESARSSSPAPSLAAAGLVRPIERGCPAGTTNYPARKRAYNCLSTYRDNGNIGHSVGLRQGRSDPSGFGYLHALQDHGVDEESIGTVIVNNAAGIARGNNRYLYGLRYNYNGESIIAIEVIEERDPSTAAPDSYRLGVVTAYCKGYTKCPPGVNATLP